MSDSNEDGLINVLDLVGPEYSSVFRFEMLNHMQSIVAHQAFLSDLNMVVAAPTGCGKTSVFELAILRMLHKGISPKCLYIAPNKALCNQRYTDWMKAFPALNLNVIELTGDNILEHCLQQVARAQIIITTPEKWDSMTRAWKKHIFLLGSINLLLIDEVHHVSEDRGAVLEAVVVRVQQLSENYIRSKGLLHTQNVMRIIALSATLPNIDDIGEWLGCTSESIHYFDESFRPVPLTAHTLSYGKSNWNPFLYEKSLDSKVYDVIRQYSGNKPTLIFCGSKKNTENLAELLATKIRVAFIYATEDMDQIRSIQDSRLQQLVYRGVGFHHAGLAPHDKAIIEQLFTVKKIQILTCTSTLAFGVNLPAHLVIIKGTNQYRGGEGYIRMNRSTVLQMMGRAGRQGLDTQGVAVVMTSDEDKAHFTGENMMEVVESTLQLKLHETLCAEISQLVVSDIAEAVFWLKKTFFYIRVRKNPALYGYNAGGDIAHLEKLLQDTCMGIIRDLADAGIVEFDSYGNVSANTEAHLMTKHSIKFNTMKLVMRLAATTTMPALITEIVMAEELKKPVRRSEKKILNELMKTVKYPIKVRVQEPHHKAYVLLQAAVSFDPPLADFTLRVEQSEIVAQIVRVLNMMHEYCEEKHKGGLLEASILLKRTLDSRVWPGEHSILCECPSISEESRNHIAQNGPKQLDDLRLVTPQLMQQKAKCQLNEAQTLTRFAKRVIDNRLSGSLTQIRNDIIIKLSPYVIASNTTAMVQRDFQYNLLVYDVDTGNLHASRTVKEISAQQEIRIPLHGTSAVSIRAVLLGPYSGLDVDLTPRTVTQVTTITAQTEDIVADLGPTVPVRLASTKPTQAKKKVSKGTNNHKSGPERLDSESKQTEDYGIRTYMGHSLPTQSQQLQQPTEANNLSVRLHPVAPLPPASSSSTIPYTPYVPALYTASTQLPYTSSEDPSTGLDSTTVDRDLSNIRKKAAETGICSATVKRLKPTLPSSSLFTQTQTAQLPEMPSATPDFSRFQFTNFAFSPADLFDGALMPTLSATQNIAPTMSSPHNNFHAPFSALASQSSNTFVNSSQKASLFGQQARRNFDFDERFSQAFF